MDALLAVAATATHPEDQGELERRARQANADMAELIELYEIRAAARPLLELRRSPRTT